MFSQKLFSLLQVLAQSFFSFVFLSLLIKSGDNINYVDWSISISIVSAIYSFNIFSGILFNKFIASGKFNTNIIFLNILGIIILSISILLYGIYSSQSIYFYLAILFSSTMQICFSLSNIVDGLGKIIYRCLAQIIIFILFSLLLFIAQQLNASMVQIISLTILCYISIAVSGFFIITINKSWSLDLHFNNLPTMISENSLAIGSSVAQSWIEPLLKYYLIALGGSHLIVLFDVSTRIASTIRTFIASINTPLISIWSKKYSQNVFNKELIINVSLATILNSIYIFLSSTIFSVFFGVKDQNPSFTLIIIITYFLMTVQNLPNIRNITLNKLDNNFYATLIILIFIVIGYFITSNEENYIWSYLIGTFLSTFYLFVMRR